MVDAEIARITQRLRPAARLPGFRPGKAPMQVVRQRFRSRSCTTSRTTSCRGWSAMRCATRTSQPVDTPKVRDLQLEEGKPLTFTAADRDGAARSIRATWRRCRVTQTAVPVTDDDVDQALSRLRERLARVEPVERPRAPSTATPSSWTCPGGA